MQTKLSLLADLFGSIEIDDDTLPAYHYQAPDACPPHYLVWSEDDRLDLEAGNVHAEKAWQGTADLFTTIDFDPFADAIESVLEDNGLWWSYEGTDYEEDTGLIHHQWLWSYA